MAIPEGGQRVWCVTGRYAPADLRYLYKSRGTDDVLRLPTETLVAVTLPRAKVRVATTIDLAAACNI